MLISMIERGCRVGFFGIGRSSSALLSCLPLDKCSVTLRSDVGIDSALIPNKIKLERIFTGGDSCRDINEDILIFSPSVRRDRREFLNAKNRGVIFSSDAEMFFEQNDRPIFAVTGSDGKSTTSTLIHLLLNEAGISSAVIGNIGAPMLPSLKEANIFVAELSSFMLSYACPKAKRGCITNITPNHLDWHSSFYEYKKTKISLAKNSEEFVISDENDEIRGAFGIVSADKSLAEIKKIYDAPIYMTCESGYICRNGKRLIEISDVKRREKHNLKNLMMAIAMTDGYVGIDNIKSVACAFDGLEHRCKRILTLNGVDYYDSSIDSTPSRTAQTLKSLGRQVVIILGGRSKGVDYGNLLPTMKEYVKYAILVGENAEEIYEAVGSEIPCERFTDFESAIKRGADHAKNVGALLLSPASTSYGMFKNYAERGEKFKQIIAKYAENENNSLQNYIKSEKIQ